LELLLLLLLLLLNGGKFWETKTTGITAVGYSHVHPRVVKFGSMAFEFQGSHKLCILANGLTRKPTYRLPVAVRRNLKVWSSYPTV